MKQPSLQIRLAIAMGFLFCTLSQAATGAAAPTSKDAGVKNFSSAPDKSTQGRLQKETVELQKIRKAAAVLVKKEAEELRKIHATGGKVNKKETEILKKLRSETATLAQQESEVIDKINKDAALLLNHALPTDVPTSPSAPNVKLKK